MKLVSRHYLVSGQVQGVGFRRFIAKRANENQVVGYVRNLQDGRVEIVARGEQHHVATFEIYIRRGPASGHVIAVQVQDCDDLALLNSCDSMTLEQDGAKPWK